MGVNGQLFENEVLRVFVPEGWKLVCGTDSDGKVSPKKLYICKGAQSELEIFSRACVSVFYYGKNEIYVPTKWFYDNVQDIEPFACGNRLWEGYTCTSLGYPYTMLTATSNGATFQVMVLRENGEHKISLDDADVQAIIESIDSCE